MIKTNEISRICRNIETYLKFKVSTINWRPPSLSELTPMISNMRLTHLGSETLIKILLQTNNHSINSRCQIRVLKLFYITCLKSNCNWSQIDYIIRIWFINFWYTPTFFRFILNKLIISLVCIDSFYTVRSSTCNSSVFSSIFSDTLKSTVILCKILYKPSWL